VRADLVELRDVLPTFLDAAGLPIPAAVEGKSLLQTLRGEPWRALLDLEHASCYAPKDGWVALMDQRYKYIFYTITGEQLLFDLQSDPHETRDLASEVASAALVREWRRKMVQHLAVRGEAWVRDVLGGGGSPTLTWIPKGYPGYDAAETRWGFNPSLAQQAHPHPHERRGPPGGDCDEHPPIAEDGC
jgi:hypothetical protein